ncbi:MAG TPA: hypothetical protein VM884_02690 [Flavisolibacter sp.]|nr:hypothetical protein [Flavisolibacter sp.]
MTNDTSDKDFLKAIYANARNLFKPRHITVLLIAEAPPCNPDRYFYFEDVKVQDSLFLEIMGQLYPDQKAKYLAAGRSRQLKRELLQAFGEDGYWLLDLWETPNDSEDPLPSLLTRLEKYIDKTTPILLIKTNVFDYCYEPLLANGYNVIGQRMPFPGSGQQKVFREKFRKALDSF